MTVQPSQKHNDALVEDRETLVPDDAAVARVTANMALAERFIDAVFADPSILDDLPYPEVVAVFLPTDDPALAEANRRSGEAMEKSGKQVRYFDV